MNWFNDDKNLVIITVLILGVGLLCAGNLPSENASILNSIISGLFGIAVGKGLR